MLAGFGQCGGEVAVLALPLCRGVLLRLFGGFGAFGELADLLFGGAEPLAELTELSGVVAGRLAQFVAGGGDVGLGSLARLRDPRFRIVAGLGQGPGVLLALLVEPPLEIVELLFGLGRGLRRALPLVVGLGAQLGELIGECVAFGGALSEVVLGAGRALARLACAALGALLTIARVVQAGLGPLLGSAGRVPLGDRGLPRVLGLIGASAGCGGGFISVDRGLPGHGGALFGSLSTAVGITGPLHRSLPVGQGIGDRFLELVADGRQALREVSHGAEGGLNVFAEGGYGRVGDDRVAAAGQRSVVLLGLGCLLAGEALGPPGPVGVLAVLRPVAAAGSGR